jgi:hypothetical protein
VGQAVFHLQKSADAAVATVLRIMMDENPPRSAGIKLRAAQTILEQAFAATREERELAELGLQPQVPENLR